MSDSSTGTADPAQNIITIFLCSNQSFSRTQYCPFSRKGFTLKRYETGDKHVINDIKDKYKSAMTYLNQHKHQYRVHDTTAIRYVPSKKKSFFYSYSMQVQFHNFDKTIHYTCLVCRCVPFSYVSCVLFFKLFQILISVYDQINRFRLHTESGLFNSKPNTTLRSFQLSHLLLSDRADIQYFVYILKRLKLMNRCYFMYLSN